MSKVRLDFFKTEREDATNEIYLDLIIRRDYSKPDKPVVSMWRGKQSRPFSRFYYKSIERAEADIERNKNAADGRKAYADEKKANKEIAKSAKPSLKAGDILTDSWGYDQTNVEFYEVLSVKGKTAIVQELRQNVTEDAYMSGKTVPVLGSRRGEPISKKICMDYRGSNIHESIKISSCVRLTLWDGKPKFVSWYA